MSFFELERAVRTGSANEVRNVLWTAFLSAVASGEQPLQAVRHPLGFVCLPVLRDDSPQGVCVHVWPDGETSDLLATSNVHCHSWHLLSYVLTGTIHNQTYDLVSTPAGQWEVHRVDSSGGTDTMVRDGRRVDLKPAELVSYHAGESYEMIAGQFHASPRHGSGQAVSVVLGTQSPDGENFTLARPGVTINPAVRAELSTEHTRALVEELFAVTTA